MTDKKLEAFFKSFSDVEEQLEFRMANETLGKEVEVISTGSPSLDDALGCGGIPLGRLVQFYGPPGAGKSLMSMLLIKEAQRKDPTAQQLFIDAEGTFSPSWAETLGLDTSKIIVVDGDMAINGRRCFTMLLGVPKEDKNHILSGKSKQGFLDQIITKSLNVNLIVLDSLGSIIPPIEDVAEVGKSGISTLARFLTTTLRKVSLEVKKANIPFVIINHKRSSMDPYGPDHTFAGGNTYGHFLSANIYFEAVNRKDAQVLNDREEKIGGLVRAKVEKSKFGPWPRQCEFKVRFDQGIVDTHEETAELALKYNIVEKPSTMSYQYKDAKWVGISKFYEAVSADNDLRNELSAKIVEARMPKSDEEPQTSPDADIDTKKKKGSK